MSADRGPTSEDGRGPIFTDGYTEAQIGKTDTQGHTEAWEGGAEQGQRSRAQGPDMVRPCLQL